MVKIFVEHVMCPDLAEPSAYGHASLYYGSIEQQGRLTLHLLIAGDSEFQRVNERGLLGSY